MDCICILTTKVRTSETGSGGRGERKGGDETAGLTGRDTVDGVGEKFCQMIKFQFFIAVNLIIESMALDYVLLFLFDSKLVAQMLDCFFFAFTEMGREKKIKLLTGCYCTAGALFLINEALR